MTDEDIKQWNNFSNDIVNLKNELETQRQNEQKFIDEFKQIVLKWTDFKAGQKYGICWTIDDLAEKYNLGTNKEKEQEK